MGRFCTDCQYCIKNLTTHNDGTVNIKCTHPVDNIPIPTGRLVKFQAYNNEIVLAPDWCPIEIEAKAAEKELEAKTAENNTPEKTSTNGKNKPQKWHGYYTPSQWDIEKRLMPLFKDKCIDDIKVGDRFHIPPFLAEKRHNVVVKSVREYCIECETYDEEYKRVIYLYRDNIKIRLLSRIHDE